jgi:A/G-specific adenine glycosylase
VNLQRAAIAVVNERNGTFPTDPGELRKLPGIGTYTAGAIAAFAYERDVAFLDTNMRRVISRVVFGSESAPEAEALDAARSLVPPGCGWTWNQALIEFGALQCTARRPACIVCPLREECHAFPTMQFAIGLKKSQARKSKAVPFEHTTRYYRGRIVETLRDLPEHDQSGIALIELGSKVQEGFSAENLPWLRGLVEGLQRDGLALIAEEPASYDTGAETSGPEARVRLP